MASISFWSLILALVLLAFTSIEGARNLQQSTLPKKVHEVSKLVLPPIPGLPSLPLPLPTPELPPLPALPVPIPNVPIPDVPVIPTVPKIPTVPGIPKLPDVPTVPGIPKPQLPAVTKP